MPLILFLARLITRRARGLSGGRHFTAGQSCYVPLGRHLVYLFAYLCNIVKLNENYKNRALKINMKFHYFVR